MNIPVVELGTVQSAGFAVDSRDHGLNGNFSADSFGSQTA